VAAICANWHWLRGPGTVTGGTGCARQVLPFQCMARSTCRTAGR
jgi:hypothetical protein